MTTPPRKLVEVWRTAGEDLGVDVLAPFVAADGHEYAALVKGFGSETGTLVDWIGSGHSHTAADEGVYVPTLNADAYGSYDAELIRGTLNDWGWQLDPASAPAWYTGSSWNE